MTKTQLRQHFRKLRRNISANQQKKAAHNLWKNIRTLPEFQRINKIALYFANDGEIPTDVVARFCNKQRKQTFFPVLTRQQMIFRQYHGKNKLQRNNYGIAEPLPRYNATPANCLDMVVMPLVSFDSDGNRLGMGGGFYDRTFAFKKQRPWSGPLLVGAAHECQRADSLQLDNWDIPLDLIVTDKQIYR